MPAYNEADNIESTIRHCFKLLKDLKGEVVVTNDGSRDNTLAILEKLKYDFPNLIIVNHSRNMGYGVALKDAIVATKGDLVVSIDSDGQFDISELPRFLEIFDKEPDILSGFRIKKQDTFFKVLSNRILNVIVNLLFGLRLRDNNCAFKLYRGEIIRNILIESRGFQAPTEILIKANALGFKIDQLPVSHLPRKKGKSALSPFKTIFEIIPFLLYLRLKILLYKKGVIYCL
jgi:glycosyltransferase involved in cell wall biosynthesis